MEKSRDLKNNIEMWGMGATWRGYFLIDFWAWDGLGEKLGKENGMPTSEKMAR